MGKKIAHAGSLFKRKSELRKIGVPGHMVPGHTLSQGGRVLISALLSSALKGNHLQRTFRQFYPPSTVPEPDGYHHHEVVGIETDSKLAQPAHWDREQGAPSLATVLSPGFQSQSTLELAVTLKFLMGSGVKLKLSPQVWGLNDYLGTYKNIMKTPPAQNREGVHCQLAGKKASTAMLDSRNLGNNQKQSFGAVTGVWGYSPQETCRQNTCTTVLKLAKGPLHSFRTPLSPPPLRDTQLQNT